MSKKLVEPKSNRRMLLHRHPNTIPAKLMQLERESTGIIAV